MCLRLLILSSVSRLNRIGLLVRILLRLLCRVVLMSVLLVGFGRVFGFLLLFSRYFWVWMMVCWGYEW